MSGKSQFKREFEEDLIISILTSVIISVGAGFVLSKLSQRGVPTTTSPSGTAPTATGIGTGSVVVQVVGNVPVQVKYT